MSDSLPHKKRNVTDCARRPKKPEIRYDCLRLESLLKQRNSKYYASKKRFVRLKFCCGFWPFVLPLCLCGTSPLECTEHLCRLTESELGKTPMYIN
jgi:hypothetical protein